MTRAPLIRYIAPWTIRRERLRQQIEGLRQRDGDSCRRCRRALRFDLPDGHDKAPRIEPGAAGSAGVEQAYLCHVRCNVPGSDHTAEVLERVQARGALALAGAEG